MPFSFKRLLQPLSCGSASKPSVTTCAITEYAPVIQVHDAQFSGAELTALVQNDHLVPDQTTQVTAMPNDFKLHRVSASISNSVVVVPNTCTPNEGCIETTYDAKFQDHNPRTRNEAAAISSIPNEILADIFELLFFCAEPRQQELPPEILLSQIIRRWRNVALSTPRLWAKVYVGFRRPLVVADTYFRRSRILPIDLRIDICRLHLCNAQFDIRSLSALVVSCISRWQRLHVHYDSTTDFHDFLRSLHSVSAPRLECIQIYRAESYQHRFANFPHNIIVGGAPALRFVRLHGLGLHCCLPPFTSVVFLELSYTPADLRMTYDQMSDMFGNLPSLTQLVIRGDPFDLGDPISAPHMITAKLLSLRSLEISGALGPNIGRFLRVLSAPQLGFLALEGMPVDVVLDAWDPAPNSSRHSSLRSLTVASSRSMSVLTLNKLRHAFPAVTHLTISQQQMWSFTKFLQGQAVATGLPNWPNLETISMKGISFLWNEPELLADVLSLRMRLGFPVQRLMVSKDVWSEARLRSKDSVALTYLGVRAWVEESQPEDVFPASQDWDFC